MNREIITITTTTTTTMMIMIIIILKIIMMMMMMLIIISVKGAIRDFYNLLSAPRTVSDAYAQATRAQSRANRVQHIRCRSR